MSSRRERRAQNAERKRLKMGPLRDEFTTVPPHRWPTGITIPEGLFCLLQNGHLLVFLCERPGGLTLMMVQRRNGKDGLLWDDLQWVKDAVGLGDHEAIEIYPRGSDLVNVANIRHLWVLPAGHRMPFGLDGHRSIMGI